MLIKEVAMRNYILIFCFLPFNLAFADDVNTIPKDFHGKWGNHQENCEDKSSIFIREITSNEIQGYAAHSKVTKVVREEDRITLNLDEKENAFKIILWSINRS